VCFPLTSASPAAALELLLQQVQAQRQDLAHVQRQVQLAEQARLQEEARLLAVRRELAGARDALLEAGRAHKGLEKQHEAEAREQVEARVVQSAEAERELEEASFKVNFFNDYRSSKLPLNRSIPDTRVPECARIHYDLAALPQMSVIICFVDETWSALLRTVTSVVDRTPRSVLAEIILLDDGSTRAWLVLP
jgi:hypothetical protein